MEEEKICKTCQYYKQMLALGSYMGAHYCALDEVSAMKMTPNSSCKRWESMKDYMIAYKDW